MSSKHDIDDFFKEQLSDHESEAPMHLWEQLYEKREKEKKVFVPWWNNKKALGTIALLLLAIPVAYFSSTSYSSIPSNSDSYTESTSTTTLSPTTTSETTTTANNDVVTPTSIATSPTNTSATKEHITTANNNRLAKRTDYTHTTNNNDQTQLQGQPTAQGPMMADRHTVREQLQQTSQPFNVKKIEDVNPATELATTTHKTLTAIDQIDSKKAFVSMENIDRQPRFQYIPPKKLKCAHFNEISKGLYADVSTGFNIAHKQLSKRPNVPGSSSYLASRKSSEFPLFSYNFGIGISQQFASGITLKTGMDYTVIKELFQFKTGTETETIIKIIKDTDGNPIGTDTITLTTDIYDTSVNAYRMVDIPLLAGYELNFPDFSLSVYGGPIVNVYFTPKGQINSHDDFATTNITQNKTYFASTVGLGWYASIGFGYKFSNKTQLRFEPYIKGYSHSFTADEHPLTQKYMLTGLRVGLRKRL